VSGFRKFGFVPTEIQSHHQNCTSTLTNRRPDENNTTYTTDDRRMTVPTQTGQLMESSGLRYGGWRVRLYASSMINIYTISLNNLDDPQRN
jgi:hypothetical protein